MSIRIVCAWLLSFVLTLGAGHISGQSPEGTDLASLRARWQQKTPAERELLRRRFEQYSRFAPEVQRELRRRAHELRGTLRAFGEAPPPWVRERLAKLTDTEREHELRRCLAEEHRRRGSHLRRRLPPDLRRRLESAQTDQERATIFRELFRRGHEEMFPRFIERAAARLELGQSERERLRATPPEQQSTVLARLRRRLILQRGRPPSISQSEWNAWQSLSDEEFLARFRLRMIAPGGGPPR